MPEPKIVVLESGECILFIDEKEYRRFKSVNEIDHEQLGKELGIEPKKIWLASINYQRSSQIYELEQLLKKIAPDEDIVEAILKHQEDYKYVRRDRPTRKAILLAGLSAYTENPINLFLKGPPSIGKTFTTTTTLDYFPRKDVWMLGGMSPTALVHDYGVLEDGSGHPIPHDWMERRIQHLMMVDKIDPNTKDKEVKRRIKMIEGQAKNEFRELMKHSVYVVDLRKKILVFLEAPPFKTFIRLRPLLSHDEPEILFKFTDKTMQTGGFRTRSVILRGWPATIFCTTQIEYIEDLATRGFTITPEMSLEKYKEANLAYAEKMALPEKEDLLLHDIERFIECLKTCILEQKVKNPILPKFAEVYPHSIPRDMRDQQHIAIYMEMNALLHMTERPILHTPREKYLLVTIGDLIEILSMFKEGGFIETTRAGIPAHIMKLYGDVMIPLSEEKKKEIEQRIEKEVKKEAEERELTFEKVLEKKVKEMEIGFSYQELVKKNIEVTKKPLSSSTLRKYCEELSAAGYIDTTPNPNDKRMVLISVLKSLENVADSVIHAFKSSFSVKNLQKWAEDVKNIIRSEVLPTVTIFSEPIDYVTLYHNFYNVEKYLSTPAFQSDNIFKAKEAQSTSPNQKPLEELAESRKIADFVE